MMPKKTTELDLACTEDGPTPPILPPPPDAEQCDSVLEHKLTPGTQAVRYACDLRAGHGGLHLTAAGVSFGSAGDVESLTAKTSEGAANTQGESASAAPLLSLAGRGSGEPADSFPPPETVEQTVARLRMTCDNALELLKAERAERERLERRLKAVLAAIVQVAAELEADAKIARAMREHVSEGHMYAAASRLRRARVFEPAEPARGPREAGITTNVYHVRQK